MRRDNARDIDSASLLHRASDIHGIAPLQLPPDIDSAAVLQLPRDIHGVSFDLAIIGRSPPTRLTAHHGLLQRMKGHHLGIDGWWTLRLP